MLPWPDRALLPAFKYAHVMTGRGCPFECRFCTSRRMWGGYRGFSAARIAEEIEMLVAEEHEHIHIHDDLFADRRERVIMLADALEDRDLLGAVEFSCAVRADRVTPDLCEALVRLGATAVTFGMESADDETQERLGKGYGLATIRRALRLLERFEIEARVSGLSASPTSRWSRCARPIASSSSKRCAGGSVARKSTCLRRCRARPIGTRRSNAVWSVRWKSSIGRSWARRGTVCCSTKVFCRRRRG
jgi:hypothetical protein